MGEDEDDPLPCGCTRGGIACLSASNTVLLLEAAYRAGLRTGRWTNFNILRGKLEDHYDTVLARVVHLG